MNYPDLKLFSTSQNIINIKDITNISQITTGGSTRNYYRIQTIKNNYIYCEYTDISEFERFLAITEILKTNDIPAPTILFQDSQRMYLIQQDLGEYLLYTAVHNINDNNTILNYYKQAIDLLVKMQNTCGFKLKQKYAARKFDEKVYQWELEYFQTMILQEYRNLAFDKDLFLSAIKEQSVFLEKSFKNDYFLHRDFQSQNIIIYNNNFYFIDYQTAYYGSNFYDAAALIFDPYVANKLSPLRAELIKYFFEISNINYQDKEKQQLFNLMVIQRLLQASAAYYKLGVKLNKSFFKPFLAPTLLEIKKLSKTNELLPKYLKEIILQL